MNIAYVVTANAPNEEPIKYPTYNNAAKANNTAIIARKANNPNRKYL